MLYKKKNSQLVFVFHFKHQTGFFYFNDVKVSGSVGEKWKNKVLFLGNKFPIENLEFWFMGNIECALCALFTVHCITHFEFGD